LQPLHPATRLLQGFNANPKNRSTSPARELGIGFFCFPHPERGVDAFLNRKRYFVHGNWPSPKSKTVF